MAYIMDTNEEERVKVCYICVCLLFFQFSYRISTSLISSHRLRSLLWVIFFFSFRYIGSYDGQIAELHICRMAIIGMTVVYIL